MQTSSSESELSIEVFLLIRQAADQIFVSEVLTASRLARSAGRDCRIKINKEIGVSSTDSIINALMIGFQFTRHLSESSDVS